jgi:hypothetical protein
MELKGHDTARAEETSAKKFSGRAPLLDMQKASVRIAMVFCNTHFDAANALIQEMKPKPVSAGGEEEKDPYALPEGLEPVKFSDLLAFTSEIRADMLLINSLSPQTILDNMEKIDSALARFKEENPSSPIVVVNLYGKYSVHGAFLIGLESRAVAKVLDGPVGYMTMIDAALDQLRNGLIKNSEQ